MECYIIPYAGGNSNKVLRASIEWLRKIGGGTIVADERRNLERALGLRRSEFDRNAKLLERGGVALTWRRKGLPYHGNVVAAFTSRDVLHMLDEREDIERMLVLGWNENDWRWWAEKRSPQEMELSEK